MSNSCGWTEIHSISLYNRPMCVFFLLLASSMSFALDYNENTCRNTGNAVLFNSTLLDERSITLMKSST